MNFLEEKFQTQVLVGLEELEIGAEAAMSLAGFALP